MNKPTIFGLATSAISVSLLATAAFAQIASTNPASVKAGVYQVEPAHTQIGFQISHIGFSNFSGFFSGASGSLTINPANAGVSKLQISVPTTSVQTTVSKLDEELKGGQWFDAAKFPVATFTSTKVTKLADGTASVAGNLTLHGVTRPVVLTARFVGAGVNPIDKSYTIGFDASGMIKRSDFGVSYGVPMIGDDVRLTIAGAFVLQP